MALPGPAGQREAVQPGEDRVARRVPDQEDRGQGGQQDDGHRGQHDQPEAAGLADLLAQLGTPAGRPVAGQVHGRPVQGGLFSGRSAHPDGRLLAGTPAGRHGRLLPPGRVRGLLAARGYGSVLAGTPSGRGPRLDRSARRDRRPRGTTTGRARSDRALLAGGQVVPARLAGTGERRRYRTPAGGAGPPGSERAGFGTTPGRSGHRTAGRRSAGDRTRRSPGDGWAGHRAPWCRAGLVPAGLVGVAVRTGTFGGTVRYGRDAPPRVQYLGRQRRYRRRGYRRAPIRAPVGAAQPTQGREPATQPPTALRTRLAGQVAGSRPVPTRLITARLITARLITARLIMARLVTARLIPTLRRTAGLVTARLVPPGRRVAAGLVPRTLARFRAAQPGPAGVLPLIGTPPGLAALPPRPAGLRGRTGR